MLAGLGAGKLVGGNRPERAGARTEPMEPPVVQGLGLFYGRV